MANDIGTKLFLEGEKYFKEALSDINRSMKVLGSEMELVASEFDKSDKSEKALSERSAVLTKEVDAQKEKVEKLRDALKNAQEGFGETDKRTQNWQTQLNKAQAELNGLEKELGETNKALDESKKRVSVFDALKDSVQKAKDEHPKLTAAIENAGKVGKKVASGGVAALKGAFAGAATAASAVVAGTAAIVKGLTSVAGAAAEAGDTVDKESQKLGVSAEQYQVLAYQAELSGTSINTIAKAASKLKAAGSDMDVSEAIAKLAAIEDPAERTTAAVELLGAKTAQELTPMLNAGTDGLKKMEQAARDSGMVMTNEAVAASSAYQNSLATLQSTATGLKNNLFAELLPGMTKVLDGLTGALTGDEGAAKMLEEGVIEMIGSLDKMLPQAMSILDSVGGALLEAAPKIVVTLADGIISHLDDLTATAFTMLSTLTQGLLTRENISAIMNAAVGVITNLVVFLAENIDLLIDSAFLCITTLCDGLLQDENLSKLVTAALDIVLKLATGMIDHLPELLHATATIITEVVKALLSYDWKTPGIKILQGLVKGVKSMFTEVKNLFKSVGKLILDTIKDILGIHSPSTVFEGLGKNLLEGLWNGIQNMQEWLVDKLRGLGSTITDALKAVFGISSPSKVFADQIGKNLGLGIGVGFENAMDDVREDMQDAIPTDFDLPEFDPNDFNFPSPHFPSYPTAGAAMTASGGVVVDVSIYIDKFDNRTDQDIRELAARVGEEIAVQIQRKQGVFA